MTAILQPVAVRTLGRFCIVRGGHPLGESVRLAHKPVELLQALIALGGREVSANRVCDALWPDQHSLDPRNLLDNTLHRLRTLLGHRDAVVVNDARLSLNPRVCWVDAWAFERLAAELLCGARDPAAAGLADPGAALQLYQGRFLQREEPRPWMLDYQTRLHIRFNRMMLLVGGRLETTGAWPRAADWYASGLEIDPLADELHRRLAFCRQQGTPFAVLPAGRPPLDSGPPPRPF